MLMATSVTEMETMIVVLVEVAGRSMLCINIDKCISMIFQRGKRVNVEKIGEIEVIHKLKYMGIVINDNTQCFRKHTEEKINQASEMANMTYSVMHKGILEKRVAAYGADLHICAVLDKIRVGGAA